MCGFWFSGQSASPIFVFAYKARTLYHNPPKSTTTEPLFPHFQATLYKTLIGSVEACKINDMSVKIKTAVEIEKMRVAGRLAAEVLEMIAPHVKAGVSTDELNRICHDYIVNEQQAIPAPLNYHGFPCSICTSVNHVICHGIPGDKVLKKGDIVNIDITVIKDGYHGDTSQMFFIGEPSVKARRLVEIARECLVLGIKMIIL